MIRPSGLATDDLGAVRAESGEIGGPKVPQGRRRRRLGAPWRTLAHTAARHRQIIRVFHAANNPIAKCGLSASEFIRNIISRSSYIVFIFPYKLRGELKSSAGTTEW